MTSVCASDPNRPAGTAVALGAGVRAHLLLGPLHNRVSTRAVLAPLSPFEGAPESYPRFLPLIRPSAFGINPCAGNPWCQPVPFVLSPGAAHALPNPPVQRTSMRRPVEVKR